MVIALKISEDSSKYRPMLIIQLKNCVVLDSGDDEQSDEEREEYKTYRNFAEIKHREKSSETTQFEFRVHALSDSVVFCATSFPEKQNWMGDIISATNGLTEKHLSSHPLWRRRMSFGRSSFRAKTRKRRESKYSPQELFALKEAFNAHEMNGKNLSESPSTEDKGSNEEVKSLATQEVKEEMKKELKEDIKEEVTDEEVKEVKDDDDDDEMVVEYFDATENVVVGQDAQQQTTSDNENSLKNVQPLAPAKSMERIPDKGILITKFLQSIAHPRLEKSESASSISSANSSCSSFASFSIPNLARTSSKSIASSMSSINLDFFTTLPRCRSLDSLEKQEDETNSEGGWEISRMFRKCNSLSSIEDLLYK